MERGGNVLRWKGSKEMRLGWMDALHHSPTTETSLSNPFRGHARLSAIARRAKRSRERKVEDGWLSLFHPQVRRQRTTTQLFVRYGPIDVIPRVQYRVYGQSLRKLSFGSHAHNIQIGGYWVSVK